MSETIVCASGYFNPIHYGHIEYLEKSKQLGDKLIVIVNSDKQSHLKKGASFMPEDERLKIVRSLRCVDAAVLSVDEDRTVCKTLSHLHPDIFTNGGDQNNDTIPEADKNKPLYPYAYFCGAFEHASMSQPSMTLDPFSIDRIQPNAYQAFMTPDAGDTDGYEGADGDPVFADEDGYERASAAMQTKLPELDEDYWGGLPASSPIQLVKLTIAKDILRFLGFSGPEYTGSGNHTFNPPFNSQQFSGTFGFEIIPNNEFQIANSDNYVVVLDSDPLLSYDASKSQGLLLNDITASKIGKRLNILATIPVNDNNGFVEYEANELVYIDMGNEFPKNISNLRLRVLNKSLGEVDTIGDSVMTLLFKD